MRLLAEVAARPLVEAHREGRSAVRTPPDERESAAEVPAQHG